MRLTERVRRLEHGRRSGDFDAQAVRVLPNGMRLYDVWRMNPDYTRGERVAHDVTEREALAFAGAWTDPNLEP